MYFNEAQDCVHPGYVVVLFFIFVRLPSTKSEAQQRPSRIPLVLLSSIGVPRRSSKELPLASENDQDYIPLHRIRGTLRMPVHVRRGLY